MKDDAFTKMRMAMDSILDDCERSKEIPDPIISITCSICEKSFTPEDDITVQLEYSQFGNEVSFIHLKCPECKATYMIKAK